MIASGRLRVTTTTAKSSPSAITAASKAGGRSGLEAHQPRPRDALTARGVPGAHVASGLRARLDAPLVPPCAAEIHATGDRAPPAVACATPACQAKLYASAVRLRDASLDTQGGPATRLCLAARGAAREPHKADADATTDAARVDLVVGRRRLVDRLRVRR